MEFLQQNLIAKPQVTREIHGEHFPNAVRFIVGAPCARIVCVNEKSCCRSLVLFYIAIVKYPSFEVDKVTAVCAVRRDRFWDGGRN
jgi:hypothetical protein